MTKTIIDRIDIEDLIDNQCLSFAIANLSALLKRYGDVHISMNAMDSVLSVMLVFERPETERETERRLQEEKAIQEAQMAQYLRLKNLLKIP
jgi:hypothetical protein